MASEIQQSTPQSVRHRQIAAWIALVFALIYPLTVAFYVIVLLVQRTNVVTLVVASLYNIFTYFEWPLPIIAIFLASVAQRNAGGRNRIAWAAIILGVVSVLAMAGVVLLLSITSHNH